MFVNDTLIGEITVTEGFAVTVSKTDKNEKINKKNKDILK